MEHMQKTPQEEYDFMDHILGGRSRWQDVETVCIVAFLRGLTALNWWENYGV